MKNIIKVLFFVLIGVLIINLNNDIRISKEPTEVYKVYLDGKSLGRVNSKEKLSNLINDESKDLKEQYNVNNVYEPSGLSLEKEYTYITNIKTEQDIYNKIKDKAPFTIRGYKIEIIYPEEQINVDGEIIKNKKPLTLNVLNKEDFEEAFMKVVKIFSGEEYYENYLNDIKLNDGELGEQIESVYFEETIKIKQAKLSVNEEILTNENDISRYLLFGTLEKQGSYLVKEDDTVETVSVKHNLNTEELLIANPELKNENVLLSNGQKLNVGLIKPVVTIVKEQHEVTEVDVPFKTEYVDDKTKFIGHESVQTEGSKGKSRVTTKVLYRNGDINDLVNIKEDQITPPVNKVIRRGTKGIQTNYTYTNMQGTGDWSWPTISPSIITSRFGYRWGRNHNGIDISGTGSGSPIFAAQGGTIITNEYHNSWGYYTVIDHHNGFYTLYAHLIKLGNHRVGTKVSKEQVIGYMGNTGYSTGTHLHFELRRGSSFASSTFLDPCRSAFSC